MIKKVILIVSVFFISCNDTIQEVVLYQNTGEIDRTYDITEGTFWDFKEDGDIDSLKIKDIANFDNFYNKLIKKKYKEKPFLNPEYAIIIKISKDIDTIYLNDKLDKGYLVNQLIEFEDTDNKSILMFFKEKNFLTQHTKSKLKN